MILVLCLFGALLALLYFLRTRLLQTRLNSLRCKHVWLIGASRGIGRATALHLASLGATLTISSRNADSLNHLSQQILANVNRILPLDLTDPNSISQAVQLMNSGLPVDILLVNAGINHNNKHFVLLSAVDIDAVLDTNFRSVAHLFSLLLPTFVERGSGTLCAISSLAAYRGVAGASIYSASKAALTNLCQSLSIELYKTNVNVVCIHPGFVNTDAIAHLKHPKPFMVTPHEAAVEIVNAVAMRHSHYGFPWVMQNLIVNLAACIPTAVYNFIMYHLN